jgi:hypothetical protein
MNTENQLEKLDGFMGTESGKSSKRRGRPAVEGSKRQAVIAARAERIANGAEIKRGRPASETSKRHIKLQERAERIARGEKIGPGRPKTKTEVAA